MLLAGVDDCLGVDWLVSSSSAASGGSAVALAAAAPASFEPPVKLAWLAGWSGLLEKVVAAAAVV